MKDTHEELFQIQGDGRVMTTESMVTLDQILDQRKDIGATTWEAHHRIRTAG